MLKKKSILYQCLISGMPKTLRNLLLYSRKFSSAKKIAKSDRQAVRQESIFVKRWSSLVCRFESIVCLHIDEYYYLFIFLFVTGSLLLGCYDNTNSSPSAPAHFFVRDNVSTRIALVFVRSKWTKWNQPDLHVLVCMYVVVRHMPVS